jgi:hypothetical protein
VGGTSSRKSNDGGLPRRFLELQFHTHPVRIVDEQSRAVAPFHRAMDDTDPGLSQVCDDVFDRRGIHDEAEVIYADGIPFLDETVSGLEKTLSSGFPPG